MNPENNMVNELQLVVNAFKVVAQVLNNSTFKPEQFQKISITLATVNDISQELEKELSKQIPPEFNLKVLDDTIIDVE